MYLLNPEAVVFDGVVLADVQTLVVDRTAKKSVIEWSDNGPYAAFADVPEQRVSVRIARRIADDQLTTLEPGDEGELRVTVSPSGARSDAGRHDIVMTCVVMSVTHELAGVKGGLQTIAMEAVSASGGSDPVSVEAIG